MKRILLSAAGLLLLAVLALAALPLIFGDAIEARVKDAIERRVDARVSYGKIGLGLFRHFPALAVTLDELTVTGVDSFDGDTLAHADRLRLVVDLGSAVRTWRHGDPLAVRRVLVVRPYLHARVLEDGRASWDVAKTVGELTGSEPTPAKRPPSIRVDLRLLEVEDGRVSYEDHRTGLRAALTGVDHRLTGDLSAERSTLETRTTAARATVRHGGITYLSEARLEAEARIDADMSRRRFAFRENRLAVNELGVVFDGWVERSDDGVSVDVAFAADRAQFRDILSMVPSIFRSDFESLRADGSVAVKGFIRGDFHEGRVPSFALEADVADGRFQYVDLPTPVRDVFLDLSIVNSASDVDSTIVELRRLDLVLGEHPFRASFRLATPISDPEVTLAVSGRLDLAAAAGALKLDGIDELRGLLLADAAVHARESWIEAEAFDRIQASGQVAMSRVFVAGEAVRGPIVVDTLSLELSPRYAELSAVRARVGASDFRGTGRLDNLLGFALRDEVLTGRAEVRSHHLALDEWKREDPRSPEIIPVPANLDLAFSAVIDSMSLGDVVMSNARGKVRVGERRITLEEFGFGTFGGDVVLSGWYETMDPARPAYSFDVSMVGIDISGGFAALPSVRAFAPVSAFADGELSADLTIAGVLGPGMAPVLQAMDGMGAIRTRSLALRDMPLLERLAEAVRMDELRRPAVSDIAASIRIADGRLHVRPFGVQLGSAALTVAGSNGIDGSLDYALELRLPEGALGSATSRLVGGLAERAGRAPVSETEPIRLDAALGGTFRDPAVTLELADAIVGAGADLADEARSRLEQEAAREATEARERVEAARAQVRARARERADSILAQGEAQAARIRAEAESAAQRIREEANRQADALLAEATNPVARRAAEVAGNRLRDQAAQRANQLTQEADRRAEQVLQEANEQAERVMKEAEGEPEAGGGQRS